MRTRPIIAVLLLLSLTASSTIVAGPNPEDPEAMLSVRPHASSEQLLQDAQRMHDQIEEELLRYENNFARERYKQGSVREMKRISGTLTKIRQYGRMAEDLAGLRETAGIDLRHRAEQLQRRAQDIIQQYRELPDTLRLAQGASGAVKALAEKNAQALETVQEFLDQGKVEVAQRRFYDLWDEAEEPIVWQPSRQIRGSLRSPFLVFEKKLMPHVEAARAARAAEMITQLWQQQAPPFDRFLGNIDASVESFRNQGTAVWGGQAKDGPELLDAWTVGWRQAHRMSLRAEALAWSLPPASEAATEKSDDSETADPDAADPDTNRADAEAAPGGDARDFRQRYHTFHQRILNAVVALIEADAARAEPAAVPDLYVRYIEVLGSLAPQLADESLPANVEPALNKLRDKSPEFAETVAGYERATREVLRWRRRRSQAYARRYSADARSLSDLLELAAQKDALIARDEAARGDVDRLFVAAPLLFEDVDRLVVGKQAIVNGIAPQGDGAFVSRLDDHCYARVADVALPAAEIAALKEDLLVTPDAPPLTLEAAIAIESAEQGYFNALGGEATAVEVDALLPRISRVEHAVHAPIGALLGERPEEPVRRLLWPVALRPQWLQHEFVFARAP